MYYSYNHARRVAKQTTKEIEMSESTFHSSEGILEDGSAVHDVFLIDEDGQTLVANAASSRTAEYLAYALNALRDRFGECGSDREVSSFSSAFDKFMAAHSKKAA
jgi:hypothetical protein